MPTWRRRRRSRRSSSSRSRPARPPLRRRWAPRWGSTASTSWTSAGSTTRPRSSSAGQVIPVELTIYEDRSFSFITKQPPAAELIKAAAGIEKGSGEPNRNKVGAALAGSGPQDRRAEDGRPERERRRRWRCASSPEPRAAWAWRWTHERGASGTAGAPRGRSRAGVHAGRGVQGPASSCPTRSSTRPSRSPFDWASTRGRRTRWSGAPCRCRTARAVVRVAVVRRGRQGARGRARPAPTSSVARSSSTRSSRATSTSTRRSPRPT